jgi:hypothetical protein
VSLASPCPDKPYEATLKILDGSGAETTEVKSDAQGHFRVALPPGAYTLVPQLTGTLPYAEPRTVTVAAGTYTRVEIKYDSGLR